MKKMKKLYVIRKYVKATSVAEAIKLERNVKPDGVWVDDEWAKANVSELEGKRGQMGYGK